jgi:Transposase IS200 like
MVAEYLIGGDSRYRKNTGAVFTLKYHLVWCPKYRRQVLVGDVATRLKELLEAKAAELRATIHALEIMPDHVHLFVESDSTRAPAHIVRPSSRELPPVFCAKSFLTCVPGCLLSGAGLTM